MKQRLTEGLLIDQIHALLGENKFCKSHEPSAIHALLRKNNIVNNVEAPPAHAHAPSLTDGLLVNQLKALLRNNNQVGVANVLLMLLMCC